MAIEDKQPALIAGHQIIGIARFAQSQQKIVGGIGRAFHARQRTDILGDWRLAGRRLGIAAGTRFARTGDPAPAIS